MKVDSNRLREAMRHWTTGVTVVCARDGETIHGMTVSSFTSVSLEPPIVLVSVEQVTNTYKLVAQSGFFGVTILRSDQQTISDRFAGRIEGVVDRLNGLETFTLKSNSPLLSGGLAAFDCQVIDDIPIGTHSVIIGQVIDVYNSQAKNPLVYYNQDYRHLISSE